MNKMNIILLIILIVPVFLPAKAVTKIQKNDNWTYTDNYGNTYNETAISQPYLSGRDFELVSVQTNRPFPFEYYNYTFSGTVNDVYANPSLKVSYNMTTNFVFQQGPLELTQVAGIPMASKRNVTMTMDITFSNYLKDLHWVFTPDQITMNTRIGNNSLTWEQMNNNPESIFSTGTPVRYGIKQDYDVNRTFNYQIGTDYVISATTPDPNNYTSQYDSILIQLQTPSYSITIPFFDTTGAFVGILKNVPPTYSFILSNDSLMPTTIVQSQPIPTGLSNTLANAKLVTSNPIGQVVYTLQTPSSTSNSTKTTFGFTILGVFILLPLIVKKRR